MHRAAVCLRPARPGPATVPLELVRVLGSDEQLLPSAGWILNSWGSLQPFRGLAQKTRQQFQRQETIASKMPAGSLKAFWGRRQADNRGKELGFVFHTQTPPFPLCPTQISRSCNRSLSPGLGSVDAPRNPLLLPPYLEEHRKANTQVGSRRRGPSCCLSFTKHLLSVYHAPGTVLPAGVNVNESHIPPACPH